MSIEGFEEARRRLDEILSAVADDDLPLDDALVLYEEAVKLGTKITGLIETDISERDALAAAETQTEGAEDGAEGAIAQSEEVPAAGEPVA